MSRLARSASESDVYHVIQRGVGQQIIFEEEEDRKLFLKLIAKYKEHVSIYAWCLMSNHVHLLVRGELSSISLFMKRLGVAYALYFNTKYDRTGHLFQGRYLSEPVNNDEYFISVVRYIHANPLKAGAPSIEKCRWTSYRDYLEGDCTELLDMDYVLAIFDGMQSFISFHQGDCKKDKVLDIRNDEASEEEDMLIHMREACNIENLFEIKAMEKSARNTVLSNLKAAGFTVRQIARATGIGRGIVQRA